MSVVQAVGKIAQAAADIANPNSNQSQRNGATNDLKEGIIELVMPKLDPETLAKYAGKWAENVGNDLKEKEEKERKEREDQQRRENLGLAQKNQNLLTEQEDKQKKGYSVTDYMEAADAAARIAKPTSPESRSNEAYLREEILKDKERIS